MFNEGFVFVYLVGLPAFVFGFHVSNRQSTFGAKTFLAWIGVFIALFFSLFFAKLASNLNLSTFETLIASATAGFSFGLGYRFVKPSHGNGDRRSLAAREWKQLERARNRKPAPPVRLPNTFDRDQLKETCQREEFVRFSLKHRLHWRTKGLLKGDVSITNLRIACRKLSAAITDWNQMKSLLAICVFLGILFGGGVCLTGLPVPWWLLMPVATVLIFAMACAAHMYSNLNQSAPLDVVLDFETGVIIWKSSSGTNRRPLSDIQQFSVRLNGISADPDGAALFAEFPDDFSLAILETPRDLKPDYALAELIPFARVVAETIGVPAQYEQFGRDHVADSYVKPWIPQTILRPKNVVPVIAVITSYYACLLWPLLR